MNKQNIEQPGFSGTFEKVAAIFAANGIGISKPVMRLMEPLLSGRQTVAEHRASLKTQLSELQE